MTNFARVFAGALLALGCGCEEPDACEGDPGLCSIERPDLDLDEGNDPPVLEGLPACAKVVKFSPNPGSDGGSRWVAIDTSDCAAVEDYFVEWRLKGGGVVHAWAPDEGTGCSIAQKWEGTDMPIFEEAWTLYVDGGLVVSTGGVPGGFDTALTYKRGADDLWIEELPGLPGCL